MNGILNILKPAAMTSHDVVGFVRRTLHIKKVGHAGTLDPAAMGVLPVFVGDATRLIEYAADAHKTYRVHMRFGLLTDSGDDTGTIVRTQAFKPFSNERLEQVLTQFRGPQQQIPPMYSAIKQQGQKLYQLARQGIEVERKPRDIFIHAIRLLQQHEQALHLEVTCSKGTYIRTLIEDIAAELDNCATMTFLLRTAVGQFTIDNAVTLEQLSTDPVAQLLPAKLAVADLLPLVVSFNQAVRLAQGVATTVAGLSADISEEQPLALYYEDTLFGIATLRQTRIKPLKILCMPQEKI